MVNLALPDFLILLTVLVGLPTAVGFGLYWLIRKAVADGNTDALQRPTH
jgi:hypothetical protein